MKERKSERKRERERGQRVKERKRYIESEREINGRGKRVRVGEQQKGKERDTAFLFELPVYGSSERFPLQLSQFKGIYFFRKIFI